MDAQTVAQIIQFILGPVVMLTSCSLVLGGSLSRYAAINDRMRLMAQERLQLLRAANADRYTVERLDEIDRQFPDLLHRHRQTHDTVLLVYCAIFLFICDMFAIALLVVSGIGGFSVLVLGLFLGGLLALMLAVGIAVAEIYNSRRAVSYEIERVAALPRGEK